MASPTTFKGQKAEELAVALLQQRGYRILERNYRCRRGEIDVVAEHAGVLCFVEVRSCYSLAHGDPLETIRSRKQLRLLRAARHYLMVHHAEEREVRFDAVGIVYAPELRIELVQGAFEDNATW